MSGPGQNVFEGAQFNKPNSLGNQTGTVVMNLSISNLIEMTAIGNITLANPTGTVPGRCGGIFLVAITQDATGGRTLSVGSSWDAPAGEILDTTANATSILVCQLLSTGTVKIAGVFSDAQLIAGATITSSTVDSTPVGGTTPAAGAFTTLSSSAAATLNSLAVTTYIDESVGNALTAAGSSRTDAQQLAKQINNVTTAGASTGVILPASATVGIGGIILLFNAGANAIKVYGSGSDTIDGTAGVTGVTLTNAKRCWYVCVAANTFVSAQLGVVSA